jgi:hypothetical protein
MAKERQQAARCRPSSVVQGDRSTKRNRQRIHEPDGRPDCNYITVHSAILFVVGSLNPPR